MYTCHEHYPCHSKTSKIYISRNIILVFPNITSTRLINIIRTIFIYLYSKFDLSEYCSYPVCIFRCNFSFSGIMHILGGQNHNEIFSSYTWAGMIFGWPYFKIMCDTSTLPHRWLNGENAVNGIKRESFDVWDTCVPTFFFKHGILKTRWACQGSWEHLV